jgi:hypothetical protein
MRRRPARALGFLASAYCVVLAIARASAQDALDAPLQTSPDGRALQLVFSDDFHIFRPLWEKGGVWRTTFGDGTQTGLDRRSLPTNAELELYVDAPLLAIKGGAGVFDPFQIRGGHLEIVAIPTPERLRPSLNGYRYLSGIITSQPSFSQTYGYFEMRARLPSGKGLWPAFWLLPEDGSWPPEIDVMESIGDPTKIYATVHSATRQAVEVPARVSPDSYHTYAVSWDRQHLAWYVDGKLIGSQSTPADLIMSPDVV